MKKKITSIILSVVLMTSMLAACTGGSQSSNGQTQNKSVESQESGEERTSYKVVLVRPSEGSLDFLETSVLQELEEKYNVDIEWDVYYNTDWSEQKSLLLAGGELPDAFFGHSCQMDTDVEKNPELFVDLTDLIPENMPNFSKIMQEDEEMMALAKNRDGRIYGLPSREPFAPDSEITLYINQRWLDNLNLEMPQTYQELENVMRAFKEQDADGDGDPDNETVVTGFGQGAMDLYLDSRGILSCFGLQMSRSINYMGLEDGTPVFVPSLEKYKDAVIWMHNLYKDGVLDQEWFTANASMNSAKNAGCVWTWYAPGEDFVPVEAVEGPDGDRYADYDPSSSMHSGAFYITKNCENPEKLLQWVDDFYTDVITLETYFGPIPECVEDNGDGTYDVLLPEDGSSLDDSAWKHSFKGWCPGYMTKAFESKVAIPVSTDTGKKLAEDSLNEQHVHDNFPTLKYTEEEADELAGIQSNLTNYAEMQYAHWVVDGGIEEEWDAYLQQLEDMQLDRYVELQTQAYQAYLDSME